MSPNHGQQLTHIFFLSKEAAVKLIAYKGI